MELHLNRCSLFRCFLLDFVVCGGCVHVCTCMCVLMCVPLSTHGEAIGGCHVFISASPHSVPVRQGLPLNLKAVVWGVGWFQQSSCLCIPYPRCWGSGPCLAFMWVWGTQTQVFMLAEYVFSHGATSHSHHIPLGL